MIRIAHLSDSHFNEHGRLQDVIDVHRAFLKQARDAGVQLIVHAGDMFERRSTPAERNAVADFLIEASQLCPVFIAKGNHDQPGDLDIFGHLNTEHEVVVVTQPQPEPHIFRLSDGRAVGCIAVPWFDKAHLVADLDATVDAELSRAMTIDAARAFVASLAVQAQRLGDQGYGAVLVGHVMVQGSEVSSGQTIIGTTVELAPHDILDVGASYAALGHVHKTQEWFEGRVAYSGSPHRCNFGEPEAKGWRLALLNDDGDFECSLFVELPARRMVLVEADWTANDGIENGLQVSEAEVSGALVRFRYRIRAESLHAVDEAVLSGALLAMGAHEVKLEAVVETETRARAPEIASAMTLKEKVARFFEAKGVRVEDGQHVRLDEKLAELEAGVGHAAS